MAKNKAKSLMEAASLEAVAELERDNKTFNLNGRSFWILSDGYEVSIHEQRDGEAPTQGLALPRSIFNRMVKFYTAPQRVGRT